MYYFLFVQSNFKNFNLYHNSFEVPDTWVNVQSASDIVKMEKPFRSQFNFYYVMVGMHIGLFIRKKLSGPVQWSTVPQYRNFFEFAIKFCIIMTLAYASKSVLYLKPLYKSLYYKVFIGDIVRKILSNSLVFGFTEFIYMKLISKPKIE